MEMFDIPTTVQCVSLSKHINRAIYITNTAVIDSDCSWVMSTWYTMKTHIFKRGKSERDRIIYHTYERYLFRKVYASAECSYEMPCDRFYSIHKLVIDFCNAAQQTV